MERCGTSGEFGPCGKPLGEVWFELKRHYEGYGIWVTKFCSQACLKKEVDNTFPFDNTHLASETSPFPKDYFERRR